MLIHAYERTPRRYWRTSDFTHFHAPPAVPSFSFEEPTAVRAFSPTPQTKTRHTNFPLFTCAQVIETAFQPASSLFRPRDKISPGNRSRNTQSPLFPTDFSKMSSQDTSDSYLQQMTTVAGTVASYMRLPVLISSGIAAVLSSLLYFKQKALIYPSHIPNESRTQVPRPSEFGITDFEELMIPTPDGEKLSAFYIRAPNRRSQKNITVLMFHGNAGNIGHRVPIARMFVQRMGCNVFMLEYRGYGLSTGSPDESGLMIDAQTGYEYLRQRAETRDHDIVVFGQSLGGAVSVQLVAKNQNDKRLVGLVLENTFLSMRKLIPHVIPPAKYLTLLCHQVWPSDTFLPSITEVPILFLSGLQDEIVPPSHMRRLYEICQSPTKVWKPLPGGDHNSSVLEEGYFESIEDFISNLDTKSG